MSVPHNEEAENCVLGTCLLSYAAIGVAGELLQPSDFHSPRCSTAFTAITALWGSGRPVDAVSVSDEMERLGWTKEMGWLVGLTADVPSTSSIKRYCEIVARDSLRRRLMHIGMETVEAMQGPGVDPGDYIDQMVAELKALDSPIFTRELDDVSFDDLRARPAAMRAPWIIPGVVRRDWRVLIVGREGEGKSLLLRQLGVCASYGVHPFTHREIAPARVLLIDLENPDDEIQDWIDRLALQCEASGANQSGGRLWHRQGGIDLRKRSDRAELEEIIRQRRPELVIMGPLYKAYTRASRETDEQVASEVQTVLDDLRTRYEFGLVMEAHAPGQQHGYREMRPFGSSLWLRWSELGLAMIPADWKEKPSRKVKVDRFRADRVKNEWPNELEWGKEWPWEPVIRGAGYLRSVA